MNVQQPVDLALNRALAEENARLERELAASRHDFKNVEAAARMLADACDRKIDTNAVIRYVKWAVARELALRRELHETQKCYSADRDVLQRRFTIETQRMREQIDVLMNMRASEVRLTTPSIHLAMADTPHHRSVPIRSLVQWRDALLRLEDVETAQEIDLLVNKS